MPHTISFYIVSSFLSGRITSAAIIAYSSCNSLLTATERVLSLIAGTSWIVVPKKQVFYFAHAKPIANVVFYMQLASESTLKCLQILLNSSWFFRQGEYLLSGIHIQVYFLQFLQIMPPTILWKSYPLNLIEGLSIIIIPISLQRDTD